jgi:hypothetical protein
MPMAHNGLAKLVEEAGEVLQLAGKLLAYPSGVHPDGDGDLYERLEKEVADLQAASQFVIKANQLDTAAIRERCWSKLNRFDRWHADPDNLDTTPYRGTA